MLGLAACTRTVCLSSTLMDLQAMHVVGILADEADPMVSVMKVCFCSARRRTLSA